jgi:peptide/nickel transport system permease protein
MARFIIRRLLWVIPVMLGVIFIVFTIDRFSPGDPVAAELGGSYTQEQYEQKEHELGLDQPFVVQFTQYVGNIVTKGDLGNSYHTGNPVSSSIKERFPITFKLAIISIIIAVGFGIPFGVISATKQYSWTDKIVTWLSLVFAAMPGFVMALILIITFSIQLKLFPASGYKNWNCWILPCIASGLTFIASITRMTRSSMLDVIRQDYITTARAKGVNEGTVIRKHALRNALIPVITVVGFQFGVLISGSVIVETIFNMPGMGSLLMTAINNKDYPVIEGCVLVLAFFICIINLLTDIAYGVIDPRIMAQYKTSAKKKVKKEAL